MARNPVQFQKGMSLAAFQAEYGRKESCEAALRAQRVPDANLAQAGTIFHKSKVPLTTWFLAIYLLTQSKNDISALELSRQLGVKYDTAWAIKHKLMAAMQNRNKAYKLKGDVQIDDAYLGGERKGTPGRGAAGKTPFLAAVETRDGKPFYIKLRRVAAFNKEAVKTYAKEALEPGSRVISDGLYCFESLAEAGMTHTAIKRGRASRRSVDPRFKWVNTCLANIKGAITGTCRAIRRRHAGRYLAAYEYRFNRRFDLPNMVPALAKAAAATAPKPYATLRAAETFG